MHNHILFRRGFINTFVGLLLVVVYYLNISYEFSLLRFSSFRFLDALNSYALIF
jgi:hypothetical protein